MIKVGRKIEKQDVKIAKVKYYFLACYNNLIMAT